MEQLKENIANNDAGDVYYSSALWLDPRNVAGKKGGKHYQVADSIMLECKWVFDFDARASTIKDLEGIRITARKFYEHMKKQTEYELEYVEFTGCKGFQFSYTRKEQLPQDPRKRIEAATLNRKTFKNSLPKEIAIYDDVSLNPLLVRRLPGTVNTKTGYLATIIGPEELYGDIASILIKIPFVGKTRPGIPYREMTSSPRTRQNVDGGESGLAPHQHQFITNQVQGVRDRYCLALQYGPGQNYTRDAKFLQKHYSVSDLYVLDWEGYAWLFSPQTFPHKRLVKILARTSAINKSQQKKFGHTLLPVAPFKFKEIISGGECKVASLAHVNLIKKLWNENFKARFLEGKDSLRYLKAELTGEKNG